MKNIMHTHKDTMLANASTHHNLFDIGAGPQDPQDAQGTRRRGRRWVRRRHLPASVGEAVAASVPANSVLAEASLHETTGHAPANNGHTPAPSGSDAPPAPAWLRALPTASALRLRGSKELRNTRALQRLPLMGRTLVRLLRDIDTTLQVVAAFGGTTVHIPAERSARALARHPLRAHLTLQQMRRVVQYFAGTDVYIPRCFQAMVHVRDVNIVQRFDQGIRTGASAASVVRELARDFRLSDRWIWTILKKTEM